MDRASNLLQTVLFCAILAAVPIFWSFHIGVQTEADFLEFDQRPRSVATSPGWDRDQLRNYFSSLERHVSDRLPFREQLLGAQVRLNLLFGKLLNPGVLVLGKDGWLFFGNSVGRGIDQHRGLLQLDQRGLSEFEKYFTEVQMAAKEAGIPFVLAIAPDKHSVYPEFLPDGLSKKGISPADQVMANPVGFEILDLRPVLIDAKASSPYPLYYKTDSHWNELGAYLGYRAIMERLPGSAPVDARMEDFMSIPDPGKRDLAIKVGGNVKFEDSLTYIRRNFLPGTLDVENLRNGTLSTLPAVDMIRVSQFPSLQVTNRQNTGTILLIGDSFLENISRYFNNTFGTVVYQSYADAGSFGISTLLDTFHPQAVVFLVVERNLILPVSRFITPAESHRIAVSGQPATRRFVIPNSALIAESRFVRGIEEVSVDNEGVHFITQGSDAYFHLPSVPPMPEGATATIELTLPEGRLVQLFYQTTDNPDFTEGNSVKEALPAGRHLVTWPINAPLNGIFRLDPGNGPGNYCIHKVEISPSISSKAHSHSPAFMFANQKLLAESSLVRGIDNIRQENGTLCFSSTGDDPYFHLPSAPPMPEGATMVVELTLPAERMVQLFYQTTNNPEFSEENSIATPLPAGRHVIEWPLRTSLNGVFRLDPGNGPGEYRIHRIEIRP